MGHSPFFITPYLPHPALQDYILSYAYIELKTDTFSNLDLFPCGITTLVIMLSQDTEITCVTTEKKYRDRFYFIGQYSRFSPFYSTSSKVITITFRSFAAFSIFGVPQHLCLDQNIDAVVLFPELKTFVPQLEDLCEQPQACIRLIEDFFLKKITQNLSADKRIIHACNTIALSRGNISIKALASNVAMSPRSLELHFKEKVGMSPKLFSRILRFSSAVQYIKSRASVDWQEVSFLFDYFDQNHFIRDCKHFYGATPTHIKPDSHSVALFVAEKISENKGS